MAYCCAKKGKGDNHQMTIYSDISFSWKLQVCYGDTGSHNKNIGIKSQLIISSAVLQNSRVQS
jgi:hypothetical protein